MGRSHRYDQPKTTGENIIMNKAIILGRLGQDPELKYTPSGMAVCNFTMATTDKFTDKSGAKQEQTEWHRIVVWGKIAELCNQYLAKGRQALVEGNIKTRSWENNEGKKVYTTEINAKSVQFLGGGQEGEVKAKQEETPAFTADDVPF